MEPNRLLVLDDEAAIGSLVATIAKRVGYAVETATNFADFREAYGRFGPTHVVLDLQLPDTDGVEVLGYLAEQGATVRVILMSGVDPRVLDVVAQVARARGFEVMATCLKPLRVGDIRAVLRESQYPQSRRVEVEDIARAIEEQEIFLEFQPKQRLSDDVICGFEALARWRHPDLGLVPPDEFIPLAEQNGLIGPLTHQVFRAAIEAAVVLCEGGKECNVAVNISPLDLTQPGLADDFSAICSQCGFPPDHITLEMTETAAMSDPVAATEALVRLRLKGFRLSIDDFGTGYSSLSRLRQLPLSELKIDRSFVSDCTTSRDSRAIVEAVVGMAHALDLSVVAEGVETQDVLEYLRQAKVNEVQGYFVSRPIDFDDMQTFISRTFATAT